jgi:RNA polymerase sigma-70 factor (ECF subfamily)
MTLNELTGSIPSTAPRSTDIDDGLTVFLRARPRLLGIASRMLGSVADAEDLVQDVWLRWQTTDRSLVRSPMAFLIVSATRLAINVRHSARVRRETSAGSWLPEPADTSPGPGLETERGEAVDRAVLLLAEKLLPVERAAYVLRHAFDYPYREIAGILHVEEANARQIVSRARDRVSGEGRGQAAFARRRPLHEAFLTAARTGDLGPLESLIARNLERSRDPDRRAAAAGRRPRRPARIQRKGGSRQRSAGRARDNDAAPVTTSVGGRSMGRRSDQHRHT